MDKYLYLLLLPLVFVTDNALSRTCTNIDSDARCNAMGYTMSAADCSGSDMLKCPLNLNKVWCGALGNANPDTPDNTDTNGTCICDHITPTPINEICTNSENYVYENISVPNTNCTIYSEITAMLPDDCDNCNYNPKITFNNLSLKPTASVDFDVPITVNGDMILDSYYRPDNINFENDLTVKKTTRIIPYDSDPTETDLNIINIYFSTANSITANLGTIEMLEYSSGSGSKPFAIIGVGPVGTVNLTIENNSGSSNIPILCVELPEPDTVEDGTTFTYRGTTYTHSNIPEARNKDIIFTSNEIDASYLTGDTQTISIKNCIEGCVYDHGVFICHEDAFVFDGNDIFTSTGCFGIRQALNLAAR